MTRKGTRAGSGNAASVSATIESAEALAVADGELQGDKSAEAVAEHRCIASAIERVHDARDVVGVICHRVEDDRRGRAEAGQVDAGHAVLVAETRKHQVEDSELREQ